ncbi:MAG: Dehydrogenase, partial [uncultured Acetobacteraceae bacterium]
GSGRRQGGPHNRRRVRHRRRLRGNPGAGRRQGRPHGPGRRARRGPGRQAPLGGPRSALPAPGRHGRGPLGRSGGGNRTPVRRPARPGGQRRHRRHGRGLRHDVGRLAPANGGQPGRRVPVREARGARDAARRSRRLGRPDVVRGRPARLGRPGGLLRHQGRGPALRQVGRHGMRRGARRRPRQLRPPRHHRNGDLGEDAGRPPGRPQRPARPPGHRRAGRPVGRAGPGLRRRGRRALPRLRRVAPHDGLGAGHRRRHDGGARRQPRRAL